MTNLQLLLIIGCIYLSHDVLPIYRMVFGWICLLAAIAIGLGWLPQ